MNQASNEAASYKLLRCACREARRGDRYAAWKHIESTFQIINEPTDAGLCQKIDFYLSVLFEQFAAAKSISDVDRLYKLASPFYVKPTSQENLRFDSIKAFIKAKCMLKDQTVALQIQELVNFRQSQFGESDLLSQQLITHFSRVLIDSPIEKSMLDRMPLELKKVLFTVQENRLVLELKHLLDQIENLITQNCRDLKLLDRSVYNIISNNPILLNSFPEWKQRLFKCITSSALLPELINEFFFLELSASNEHFIK